MTEVARCPNCNAQIHMPTNSNIIKCEYCDTEIIINESTITKDELNYPELKKKWKKSFRNHLIIQAVLSAFFGIFMEADLAGIGVIIFFTSIIYCIALPCHLFNNKPVPPIPNKNNKFIDFMKIYLPFTGAFWGGMILIAIIVSV